MPTPPQYTRYLHGFQQQESAAEIETASALRQPASSIRGPWQTGKRSLAGRLHPRGSVPDATLPPLDEPPLPIVGRV